jgi:hypothetical protein
MSTIIGKNSDFLTRNASTSAIGGMGRYARCAFDFAKRHNRAVASLALLLGIFGTSAALKAEGPLLASANPGDLAWFRHLVRTERRKDQLG